MAAARGAGAGVTAGLPTGTGAVLTVGSFDGVHRGHLAVLDEIARRARSTGRASVLVTFEPHPMEVVNPAAAPPLITTPLERREILAQTALDYVAILRFDRRLQTMPPERFVREILLARFGMRELVIGEDHGFGRARQGDVALLRHLGAAHGFAVDVVEPVPDEHGIPISSTRIRRAIAGGDLEQGARLLGRPFQVSAQVRRGAGRGRRIGVPTANLALQPRKLLPPDGVYAAWVEWPGGRTGGMLNQGPRPTVGDPVRSLEVHLFGFEADLYGAWLRIEYVRRIRDVAHFPSLAALRTRLNQDREDAERMLGGWLES